MTYEIFLGQGKYVVEILKRFGVLDYKSMATPMESNMNLLDDTTSEAVDATLYRKMIGSLMYLMNTRPDICFVHVLTEEPAHANLDFNVSATFLLRRWQIDQSIYTQFLYFCRDGW
jgi:hypothetical protein